MIRIWVIAVFLSSSFRWRLLPRDTEWTLPGYGREAQFVLTEPGEYQFEAEAMTVDNRPSDRPVRVVLRVPPLWHELGAVRVGAGLLLLACGWLVFRFGAARARSREQRLERLVGERTSALRHARENLELRVAQRTSALQCALEQIETNHEQKRRMERELDQLRRMESLGQLAGGIAHDFNNLLMTTDEAASDTHRTFLGVTTEQAVAAAERVLWLADGDDFAIDRERDGLMATRNWTVYFVLGFVTGTDQWIVKARPVEGGTDVTFAVGSVAQHAGGPDHTPPGRRPPSPRDGLHA